MRVHLVQFDIAWEDRFENHRRVRSLLNGATIGQGDLVVLPEMFDSGFGFNVEATADRDGGSRDFLAGVARERRCWVVGGITAIESDARPRNRALCLGPDGAVVEWYDKHFLFPLGDPSEASRFEPGSRVATFGLGSGATALGVAPLICYDLRFPELFLGAVRAGAEAIALIANWPSTRASHWRALSIARAIECQAFVFAVNRCGQDPSLAYAGGSLVIDPQGRVLAEADEAPQVLSAPIDPEDARGWRGRFPALRDRLNRG